MHFPLHKTNTQHFSKERSPSLTGFSFPELSRHVQFLFNNGQQLDTFPQIWSKSITNNPTLLMNWFALFGPTTQKIGHTMHSHHKLLFTDGYQGRSMTLP